MLVLVGLWLQSRIARYIGAVFYFFSAGVAAFALWGGTQVNVGVVWAATMAVLGLAGALILIFLKSFARGFAAVPEKQPPYKKDLLNAFTLLVFVGAAAAALIDFVL